MHQASFIYLYPLINRKGTILPPSLSIHASWARQPLRCYAGYQITSWSVKCRWSTTNAHVPSLIKSQLHRRGRRPGEEGGWEVYAAKLGYMYMTDGVSQLQLIDFEGGDANAVSG